MPSVLVLPMLQLLLTNTNPATTVDETQYIVLDAKTNTNIKETANTVASQVILGIS